MAPFQISNSNLFYTFLSIVSLGILIKIYDYLNKLENCDCYNDAQAYNKFKINIEFLKAYQIFEMFLVIMLLYLLFSCDNLTNVPKIHSPFSATFLTTTIIMLLAFVSGYITYNVFLLYALSKSRCKCVDKWQKYFVYVQGIMASVTFLRILFLLLLVFVLLIPYSNW